MYIIKNLILQAERGKEKEGEKKKFYILHQRIIRSFVKNA